jgi:hypothetical protein
VAHIACGVMFDIYLSSLALYCNLVNVLHMDRVDLPSSIFLSAKVLASLNIQYVPVADHSKACCIRPHSVNSQFIGLPHFSTFLQNNKKSASVSSYLASSHT